MTEIQAAIPPVFERLPAELKTLPRWVGWRYENKSGSEKATKIPRMPHGGGGNASSTTPATWGTFEQAHAAYLNGGLSGIGFVLDGDGLVGVDIDHCVSDGKPSTQAMGLLDKLGAAYIEVSPSGTGLRAIGYGEQLDKGVNGSLDGLKAEFYSKGRFLTMTGKTIKAGPITPLKGFRATAEAFAATKRVKVNPETGEIETITTDEKQAALVQRLLSGDVYHDSLRDLAAAWVSGGMTKKAAIAALEALMDHAVQRDEWKARRNQIPDLVVSAYEKYVVKHTAADIQRYKLLGADDLRNLPPLAWRVRGVLPAVGLAGLYGPSASGKSFLALDMSAAIAEGCRWFDCRVTAAPVVYCALEGEAGFKLRVAAWEQHNGRPLPAVLSMVLQPFMLTQAQDVADLAAAVPVGAVVFLDTLNRAAPTADENSSKDMGAILQAAKTLQALTGGLVVLVHHTGKDSSRGLRGHSSLFAALDAAIEVSRDGERREWKVAKSKDGQDGGLRGFSLVDVDLGLDDDGEDMNSCVVAPATATAVQLKPLTSSQQQAMDALITALKADVFDTGVSRNTWRESFYLRTDRTDAKRKAFTRAVDELQAQWRVYELNGLFSIPDL
ncbi:AAA family ATPase [Polaromonas sp.]|uniref:AAA family ATPase n=1 Tax=Polaromonas sp. TaxID=1869339 RepID=UPI0017D89CDD|nr:AAA family ATPase [Polaromonas sp.]NML87282.1 AAA family ATPase [Polaromonas sp.]